MNTEDRITVLLEAIDYISRFESKIIVVKYGGNAMADDGRNDPVFEDMALLAKLGLKLVVVHGGGPRIDEEMKRHGIPKKLIHGLRVTDADTLDIVSKVLSGVNEQCVHNLKHYGVKADNYTKGLFLTDIDRPELGFVGNVVNVKTAEVLAKIQQGVVPVVSSLGQTIDGQITNINADTAAAELAIALKAEKLTILTNVDSVLDDRGQRLNQIKLQSVSDYIEKGIIHSGMIPKTLACAEAVKKGVKKAHLINGTQPRALLLELLPRKV